MQIHSQEEPPAIDQLGFGAAPGHQTFVSCQQQQVCWFNCLCLPPAPNSYPPQKTLRPQATMPRLVSGALTPQTSINAVSLTLSLHS